MNRKIIAMTPSNNCSFMVCDLSYDENGDAIAFEFQDACVSALGYSHHQRVYLRHAFLEKDEIEKEMKQEGVPGFNLYPQKSGGFLLALYDGKAVYTDPVVDNVGFYFSQDQLSSFFSKNQSNDSFNVDYDEKMPLDKEEDQEDLLFQCTDDKESLFDTDDYFDFDNAFDDSLENIEEDWAVDLESKKDKFVRIKEDNLFSFYNFVDYSKASMPDSSTVLSPIFYKAYLDRLLGENNYLYESKINKTDSGITNLRDFKITPDETHSPKYNIKNDYENQLNSESYRYFRTVYNSNHPSKKAQRNYLQLNEKAVQRLYLHYKNENTLLPKQFKVYGLDLESNVSYGELIEDMLALFEGSRFVIKASQSWGGVGNYFISSNEPNERKAQVHCALEELHQKKHDLFVAETQSDIGFKDEKRTIYRYAMMVTKETFNCMKTDKISLNSYDSHNMKTKSYMRAYMHGTDTLRKYFPDLVFKESSKETDPMSVFLKNAGNVLFEFNITEFEKMIDQDNGLCLHQSGKKVLHTYLRSLEK